MIFQRIYYSGYATSGPWFTYKGVRYGHNTVLNVTEDFCRRVEETIAPWYVSKWERDEWFKNNRGRTFMGFKEQNGKLVWLFSGYKPEMHRYINIDPDRDFEKIITPIWYLEPKEMVRKRLKDGTWFDYVWPQTLFYVFCLLISPIFNDWLSIWTGGLFLYLWNCYKILSKGEYHYYGG